MNKDQSERQPAAPELVAPETISPEAYNAIIAGLLPMSVNLIQLSMTTNPSVTQGGLLRSTSKLSRPKVATCINIQDGKVLTEIHHEASFALTTEEDVPVIEGIATYSIRIQTEFAPPQNFWPIFLLRNVKLYTHPALRDLVSSLATRAGVLCAPLSSVSVVQNIVRDN